MQPVGQGPALRLAGGEVEEHAPALRRVGAAAMQLPAAPRVKSELRFERMKRNPLFEFRNSDLIEISIS
jgi:hypothetical protein